MAKKFIYYTNDIEEIRVPDDTPCPDGWHRGFCKTRRYNIGKAGKGREAWNKGLTKETDERVLAYSIKDSEAHLGKPSWCRGLTKETDERVMQLSLSLMGHEITQETRDKIGKANSKPLSEEAKKSKREKEYITKKKNGTFKSSKFEDSYYSSLCEEYGQDNVVRQYKEERYPFYCDFYIKSEDLFIELNAHWTHGGMLYDESNKECQEKLTLWTKRAKDSKYYRNAITTWTVRDVEKYNTAKKNNLNYKVIY